MPAPIITERSVIGTFYERLMQNTGSSWIDALTTPVLTSDQDSETYPWLGQVPQMSELKGDKQFDQLRAESWTVANVQYQGGISIPLKFVLYDKTDQVDLRVNELADRTDAHWLTLVAPLILNGESAACYDSQYFFDTDHSEGESGAQSNDINADISGYPVATHGTTTAPSAGEIVFAVMAGIEQMLTFKDDQGEFCNEHLTEFRLVAGTTLMTPILQALSNRLIDGGNGNLLMEQGNFRISLTVSPRFNSWTTKFALFTTQGTQKPFIRQQRVPNHAAAGFTADGLRIVTLWDESEHCKLHDECLMSVETERAAAYGDWKKACLVTLV